MEIVIDSYGSYLRKKDNALFAVKTDKEFTVACSKVERILISTAATITTAAIKLAIENNVDIAFIDKFGSPYARLWYAKSGGMAKIKKAQLNITDNPEATEIAKTWIVDKINNQVKLLRYFSKNKDKIRESVLADIELIKQQKEKIRKTKGKPENVRGSIMGYEGGASKTYFKAVSKILPAKYSFNGRSRNPGQDFFNTMLNYAYGVLYSRVEKELILAGLDPYLGFLHASHHNNKTLVFDMIEAFRFIADNVVVSLFTSKKIKPEYFDEITDGYLLNKQGKKVFFEKNNEYIEKTMRYKGKTKKIKHIMGFESHMLANILTGGLTC